MGTPRESFGVHIRGRRWSGLRHEKRLEETTRRASHGRREGELGVSYSIESGRIDGDVYLGTDGSKRRSIRDHLTVHVVFLTPQLRTFSKDLAERELYRV